MSDEQPNWYLRHRQTGTELIHFDSKIDRLPAFSVTPSGVLVLTQHG